MLERYVKLVCDECGETEMVKAGEERRVDGRLRGSWQTVWLDMNAGNERAAARPVGTPVEHFLVCSRGCGEKKLKDLLDVKTMVVAEFINTWPEVGISMLGEEFNEG